MRGSPLSTRTAPCNSGMIFCCRSNSRSTSFVSHTVIPPGLPTKKSTSFLITTRCPSRHFEQKALCTTAPPSARVGPLLEPTLITLASPQSNIGVCVFSYPRHDDTVLPTLGTLSQPLRHANHLPRGRDRPGGVRCAPHARWHHPRHVARCRHPANSNPQSPHHCVAGRPRRCRRTEGGGCTISEGAQRRTRCEGATPHRKQRCCPPCAVSPCCHDIARHNVACTNPWHAFCPSTDNTQQQHICPIGN